MELAKIAKLLFHCLNYDFSQGSVDSQVHKDMIHSCFGIDTFYGVRYSLWNMLHGDCNVSSCGFTMDGTEGFSHVRAYASPQTSDGKNLERRMVR